MNPRLLPVLALVLGGGISVVHADMIPGVDQYVENAGVIELVQAEMPASSESCPPPMDKQRVWVRDILKGVDTTQEFLLPAGKLQPGQLALVLFQYDHPNYYQTALMLSDEVPPPIVVWPMDALTNMDTGGVPVHTEGGFGRRDEKIEVSLDLVKNDILASSPEDVGLNQQVQDALLFPDKFQTLARQDASRATYVAFVAAILDLSRDVPRLAALLESPDKTVRAAALKQLEKLTGDHLPAPPDEQFCSLHEWAQQWARQQNIFTRRPMMRWPPVPADLKAPLEAFPEPLLQAVRRDDAGAFGREFAAWLDSGVMRDREINYAATNSVLLWQSGIIAGSGLGGAIGQQGPYLPDAPRLRPDVILNTNIPAQDRLQAMVLRARLAHYRRFAREQAGAIALVTAAPDDSEILRCAAFWEMRDANINTAGRVALNRLAQAGADESSQRFALALCFDDFDGDAFEMAQFEIKAGRQIFIDGLFDYLAASRDYNAQFIARLLCQEGQKRVIPVMLAWLKDNDAAVRKAGAFNLCWLPDTSIVSNLLAAINSEKDPGAKAQMLMTLAQTGDEHGLETLLSAAREPCEPYVKEEFVRGLARIRDPRALPALADIASGLAWLVNGNTPFDDSKAPAGSAYLLSDAVNAFGYVSHAYKANAPDEFWSQSAFEPDKIRLDLAQIEQWRKSQGGRP